MKQAQKGKRHKLSLLLLPTMAPQFSSPKATRVTSYSCFDAERVYTEDVLIASFLSTQTKASCPGGFAPCFFLHKVFPHYQCVLPYSFAQLHAIPC